MQPPLNDIDARIVAALRSDGRLSNKELAARVGLPASTALARVRSLERRRVITGYRATVDQSALGRDLQALVFVRLRPKTDEAVRAFVAQVWSIEDVVGVYLVSGADDAIIHVAVRDTDHLRAAVLERITGLGAVVDERTALVFEHRSR